MSQYLKHGQPPEPVSFYVHMGFSADSCTSAKIHFILPTKQQKAFHGMSSCVVYNYKLEFFFKVIELKLKINSAAKILRAILTQTYGSFYYLQIMQRRVLTTML